MVKRITSLTGSGVKDFFMQRMTAIVLAVYLVFLVVFALETTPLTYAVWASLFHCFWMKVFTVLALIALIKHAWVGMWTIFTDYIHCGCWRGILMCITLLLFLVYLIWGIQIVWSV